MSIHTLSGRSFSTGGRVLQARRYGLAPGSDDHGPVVLYEPAYPSAPGRTARHLSQPPEHAAPSRSTLPRRGKDCDGQASPPRGQVSPRCEMQWPEMLQTRAVVCQQQHRQQQQQQMASPAASPMQKVRTAATHTRISNFSGQTHQALDVDAETMRVQRRLVTPGQTPGGSLKVPGPTPGGSLNVPTSTHLASGIPRTFPRHSSHSPASIVRRTTWHRSAADFSVTAAASRAGTLAVLRKVEAERAQMAYRVPEEFLVGDPWKGCEDIVHEDLVSWFMECLIVKNHTWTSELVDEIMSAVEADSGNDMSKECFPAKHISPAWPHWGHAVEASRSASGQSNTAPGSIGTMSTVSSLGSASQNSSATLNTPTQSSAPDEVQAAEIEEVDNDWEFEFMLREAFDIHLRKEETAFLQKLK
mmetsp:Transcript_7786/g.14202  ORF Transcript_7786/g.14202 Transcript_7786/m.14202 type:complete len:416 (-) Transcript_7786:211-1458(-)